MTQDKQTGGQTKGGQAKGGQTKGGQAKGGQTKGGQTKGDSSQTKSSQKQHDTKESKEKSQQKQNEDGKTNEGKEESPKSGTSKGSGGDTSRKSKSGSETARSSRSEESPRSKKQNYFKQELKRLKDSLEGEASKIEEPEMKEHIPYVFNSLEPYYNCYTTEYLMEYPETVRHEFATRKTATGLCDPWVDHNMDVDLDPRPPLPKKEEDEEEGEGEEAETEEEKSKKKGEKGETGPKEGSTRLPKYPVVTMQTSDLNNKDLYYSDVPTLRDELDKKYSSNAEEKINADYKRTKDDFYRMELHKTDEYHPLNRDNMRKAYFAYLQNNPGSKKAVKECVKETQKKEEEDKKAKDKKQSGTNTVSSSRQTSARSSREGQHDDTRGSQRSVKSTTKK